ncbi:MAG: hypothetical protein LBP59_11115 [Planctomycetaceae bacterium]|jgi:hypothetical protein|nr:hypothetical protein [Planctomycetaceae bacterium]
MTQSGKLMQMNDEFIMHNFEPYVRVFGQRWNAYLERENKLFAEIYARPVDGMIGVAFYVVKRQTFPDRMRIINDSFEKLKEDFPESELHQQNINHNSFVEVLENVIIVIKPNNRHCWGEEQGIVDADETIGIHFVTTIPEEWKNKK